MSLVPFPKKAGSRSPLSYAPSGSRLAGCFLFHSTPVAGAQAGLFRSATGSSRKRIFGGSVGDWGGEHFPLFTQVVEEANVRHETRQWTGPTVWRRCHLVGRGPNSKTWCVSHAQSCPQFPGTWSCLALSAIPVTTHSRKELGTPGPSGILSSAYSTLAAAVCHGCGCCWWRPLLGTDGCATAVRAQRRGYTS